MFLVCLSILASGLVARTGGSDTAVAGPALPRPAVDADYYEDGSPVQAKVELGRLLFFDKILSGNRNISCAT
ncbi:MAG: hypothetical protein KDD47_10365, partial [Acidobacteria bacterium]|nr:hypothetical protein [Acidobacteriota bacterium]